MAGSFNQRINAIKRELARKHGTDDIRYTMKFFTCDDTDNGVQPGDMVLFPEAGGWIVRPWTSADTLERNERIERWKGGKDGK